MIRIILLIILLLPALAFSSVKSISEFSGKDVLTQKEITVDPKKADKATIVIFVSANCPCSASHEKIIGDMTKEFSDFKFVAVHSNMDESLEFAKDHFSISNLPLSIIQDDHAKIADQFRAFKTPHAFVLDKAGQVIYSGGITNSHIGPNATKNYLKETLTALKKGEKPAPREERSLGCIISRKE